MCKFESVPHFLITTSNTSVYKQFFSLLNRIRSKRKPTDDDSTAFSGGDVGSGEEDVLLVLVDSAGVGDGVCVLDDGNRLSCNGGRKALRNGKIVISWDMVIALSFHFWTTLHC